MAEPWLLPWLHGESDVDHHLPAATIPMPRPRAYVLGLLLIFVLVEGSTGATGPELFIRAIRAVTEVVVPADGFFSSPP